MSNTETPGSAAAVQPVAESRRRVLLVDSDPIKRKLRLSSMTQKGIEVCLAADVAEARLLVRESPYDLVLIDLPRDRQAALKLGKDIKDERFQQPVCFYVGRPDYLAATPLAESEARAGGRDNPKKDLHALITRTCDHMPGRGRLLEAAWRICVLRRKKSEPALLRSTDPATARDSFGTAVRLAEQAGLDS